MPFKPVEVQKVRQETQKVIYNVLRCPLQLREMLIEMYGEYRHFNAGSGVVDSCYTCLSSA